MIKWLKRTLFRSKFSVDKELEERVKTYKPCQKSKGLQRPLQDSVVDLEKAVQRVKESETKAQLIDAIRSVKYFATILSKENDKH